MNLVEKYRPCKLSDILGQPWIVQQLETFLESPHPVAFLFEGSSGTGKTSTALVLAEALGVDVAQAELGGLWQIASGEQTGETGRAAVANLRTRPWYGSGWRVLIVNEADAMTPNAAYTWLDVLENLPPQTAVIFTTNAAARIPGRLRDRCERFAFQSGGLLMRLDLQELVNRVWLAETGRTDAPEVEALGEFTDANGDASFRRVLQRLAPFVRARQLPEQPESPMMQTYREAKARHPGMILLFRMGDFYEAFDGDAEVCAKVLGLTITRRDKGVAMAGFLHHTLEVQLRKLLQAGHRVAVCDQVDPMEPVVGKKVTRVVTPGVISPSFDAADVERRRNAGESWGVIAKELQLPVTTIRGRMKRLSKQKVPA
jgi:MutS domain I/ATPase family associated with various cellular activities (AAA)